MLGVALAGLTTGHKIGLAGTAVIFVAFALVSAALIPRRKPDFPAKLLPAFLIACVTMFLAMMAAVEVFGAEEEKPGEHGTAPPAETTTQQQTTTQPSPSAADLARGRALYASLGCKGCHSLDGSKNAGPTFKGLAGSTVPLVGGTTVTADDAYLLESIEDPDKQIVRGFPKGLMSATIKPGQVSDADAKTLVAYIDSLK